MGNVIHNFIKLRNYKQSQLALDIHLLSVINNYKIRCYYKKYEYNLLTNTKYVKMAAFSNVNLHIN